MTEYRSAGMKAKTIKKIIEAKIEDWAASVEDSAIQKIIRKKTIVTGGCVSSMLLGEKVNDFDVYMRDEESAIAIAKYYVGRFKIKNKSGIDCPITVQHGDGRVRVVIKSAGIASEDGSKEDYQYFESRPDGEADQYVGDVLGDPGDIEDTLEDATALAQQTEDDGRPAYRPVFMSTNAISLSHRVQVVLRFFGEPDTLHENYDFVHCTCYWTSWDNELVLRPAALEAMLARELRYVGSRYPICSVLRLRKFIRRGWRINAGQVLKMAMQISALDLTDPKVLEDQLTGVDAAYFVQLLDKLREKDPAKIDAAYLVEIVDRMF